MSDINLLTTNISNDTPIVYSQDILTQTVYDTNYSPSNIPTNIIPNIDAGAGDIKKNIELKKNGK